MKTSLREELDAYQRNRPPADAVPQQPMPQPHVDLHYFKVWFGGQHAPVPPTVEVEVLYRNGEVQLGRADHFDWTHVGYQYGSDIVGWREAPIRKDVWMVAVGIVGGVCLLTAYLAPMLPKIGA